MALGTQPLPDSKDSRELKGAVREPWVPWVRPAERTLETQAQVHPQHRECPCPHLCEGKRRCQKQASATQSPLTAEEAGKGVVNIWQS